MVFVLVVDDDVIIPHGKLLLRDCDGELTGSNNETFVQTGLFVETTLRLVAVEGGLLRDEERVGNPGVCDRAAGGKDGIGKLFVGVFQGLSGGDGRGFRLGDGLFCCCCCCLLSL